MQRTAGGGMGAGGGQSCASGAPPLRALGRTGHVVPAIGLGLAALGRPGYINLGHSADLGADRSETAMGRHAHKVLDAAWQLGVRYFDAARSYGQAEAFLGSWMLNRGLGPESVAVGSKWGYTYTAGWRVDAEVHEVKDHTLDRLRRQWQESRALLGDALRLYQIHSATLESGVLQRSEVLNELARLKAQGIAIGLSTSGARQSDVIARACAVRIDGEPLFDTVQATWNLLDPSAGVALARAAADGCGVIIKEALANGRLTFRNPAAGFTAARATLAAIGARTGAGIDAVAIAAALARPWRPVVLSGAATTEQLSANLRALDVDWREEDAAAVASLAEDADAYWRQRAALAWN